MSGKDVFISYKSEEADEANWVRSVLEDNGISCWMAPASIPGGSSYATVISQAINEVKIFVLILSSKAQSSQWVSREVDLAVGGKKVILPFMMEDCPLKDDFNFYLTNVQRYTAYEDKAAAMEKMLREIKTILGSDTPVVSPKAPEPAPKKVPKKASLSASDAKYCVPGILSLVFGILSMILFLGALIVPNIAAVVLSVAGLKSQQIHHTKGTGLTISGQVLGLVSMVFGLTIWLSILGFILALVVDAVSLFLFVRRYKALKAG